MRMIEDTFLKYKKEYDYMRTPARLKEIQLSHLNWCLEKLKYREGKCDEELYNYIYRYIYKTILEMDDLEPMEAIRLYRNRIDEKHREILGQFNIELSI